MRRLARREHATPRAKARFLALVWQNRDLIDNVGLFDLVEDLRDLDHEHAAVIQKWVQEPWVG